MSTPELINQWNRILTVVSTSTLISGKEEILLFMTNWMSEVLSGQSAQFRPAIFKEEAFKIIYAGRLPQ